MNKMINKLLLAGDMLIYEMRLRQPIFRNSACAQFTENKKRIQKVKQTGDLIYIYQNELYKACFQHDMAYGDLKIYLEEQVLVKYYMIKYLILLKIQNKKSKTC